jgi:hypothetical protein
VFVYNSLNAMFFWIQLTVLSNGCLYIVSHRRILLFGKMWKNVEGKVVANDVFLISSVGNFYVGQAVLHSVHYQ